MLEHGQSLVARMLRESQQAPALSLGFGGPWGLGF